jgi:hypothetical protein
MRRACLALLLAACGDADTATPASQCPGSTGGGGHCDAPPLIDADPRTLSEIYPGDVGIATDPAVVFTEDFEEGSVEAVVARWDDAKTLGLALSSILPAESSGSASMAMTAGGTGPAAADLYRRVDAHDWLYLRYYARYAAGIEWHHTSAWIGGYNPSTSYPNPQAGLKPEGDDRFSIAFEPVSVERRLDFYNYWMNMHSGAGSYYGNTLIHDRELLLPEEQWMCVEIYVRLDSPELAVWKDDALIVHFTATSPLGFWIQDKFCPDGIGDDDTCVTYAPPPGTPHEPLNLESRTTPALQINWIWPQNYITSGPAGTVLYDDLVVATRRIGCLR